MGMSAPEPPEPPPAASADDSERFRAGVGLAILRADGSVLAGQRNQAERRWQLPQGGLLPGESVEAGCERELCEELGLSVQSLVRLGDVPVWLGYELDAEDRSSKSGRGQVHRWTIFYSETDDVPINVGSGPDPEFVAAEWMSFNALIEQAAPFRRDVYQAVHARADELLADYVGD